MLLFSVCLPSEFVSAQRKDQRSALTNTSNWLSSRVSHAVVEASGSDLCIPLNKKYWHSICPTALPKHIYRNGSKKSPT